jgi:uncharacterized membrane protein YjfL (UPF0719 family)
MLIKDFTSELDLYLNDFGAVKIIAGIAYLISCTILLFLGRMAYKIVHSKTNIDAQLMAKDNFSFAFSYVGYFLGILLVILGALSGESQGIATDVVLILLYGIVGIILLFISAVLGDTFILNQFKIKQEILQEQNLGSGIAEAAMYVSSGIIVKAALTGEGGNVLTVVAFWAISQLLFIITGFLYQKITPYNIHNQIKNGNVAVAIGFAGALLAISIVIFGASQVTISTFWETAIRYGIYFVVGILLLPFIRVFTDKVLLPGRNLTDEIVNQETPNYGAAVIEAFAYVGGAILISMSF